MKRLLLVSTLILLSKLIVASDSTVYVSIQTDAGRSPSEAFYVGEELYKNFRLRIIPGTIICDKGKVSEALKTFKRLDFPEGEASSLYQLNFAEDNKYVQNKGNYLTIIITADQMTLGGMPILGKHIPAIISEQTWEGATTEHQLNNIKINYHGGIKFSVSSDEVDLKLSDKMSIYEEDPEIREMREFVRRQKKEDNKGLYGGNS